MGEAGQPLSDQARDPMAIVVVSNTSPLTNLAAIGQFALLQGLFGQLHVAEGVVAELSFGGKLWPGAVEVKQANWLQVHHVQDRNTVEALRLELDAGEAETITLALQLRAGLVLLDEIAGRRAAQHLGLNVIGVVGLLVRAKQNHLIPAVQPLLESLRREAGFYLSQPVVNHALALAGEQ